MKRFTAFIASLLFTTFLWATAYHSDKKADLIIFSYNRPLQLYALLESIERNIIGLGQTHIIYRASGIEYTQAYQIVQDRFAHCVWHAQGAQPAADFKLLTEQAAFKSPHAYIMFAVDDIIVKDRIYMHQLIDALEEYQAYGFYLRMGLHLTECYPLQCAQKLPLFDTTAAPILSWQFYASEHDWAYPHTVDMTLYRKKDIERDIRSLIYDTPNILEGRWSHLAKKNMHKKGLCYTQSKVVNVPLNRIQTNWNNRHMNYATPQELLEKFNAGLKIDINPLHMIVNPSAHMDYVPVFVKR